MNFISLLLLTKPSPLSPLQLADDVHTEASKCGSVLGVAIPRPPGHVPDKDACRAYVRFSGAEAAGKCRAMMDGRMFDVNKVKATFVSESDFARAQAGEWIAPSAVGMPPGMLPGMMGGMPGYGLPGYPAYPPQ